jgi:hypothetical protein
MADNLTGIILTNEVAAQSLEQLESMQPLHNPMCQLLNCLLAGRLFLLARLVRFITPTKAAKYPCGSLRKCLEKMQSFESPCHSHLLIIGGPVHWKGQSRMFLLLKDLTNLPELLLIVLIVRKMMHEEQVDVLPHLNATKTERVLVLLTQQIKPILEHRSQIYSLLVIDIGTKND